MARSKMATLLNLHPLLPPLLHHPLLPPEEAHHRCPTEVATHEPPSHWTLEAQNLYEGILLSYDDISTALQARAKEIILRLWDN